VEDLLDVGGTSDHCSRNDIAVAADVFGRTVHDEVYPVLDRLLKEGRRPAVVDACECIMLSGDIGDRAYVESPEHHRARILQPDELGAGKHRALHIVRLDVEQQRMLDSESLQVARELKRRSIGVIDEEDVIALLEQSHDHSAHRGHSRSERLARFAAFQRGQLPLEHFDGWILAAGVNGIPAFSGTGGDQGIVIWKGKQRRLHDRRCHRVNAGIPGGKVLETDRDISGIDCHAQSMAPIVSPHEY